MNEKRIDKRELFTVTLEYTYHHKDNGYGESRSAGLTTNISDRGIGLYTDRPLPKGQKVSFHPSSGERMHEAQVRWCRKISETLFRVGFLFDECPAFPA